MYRQLASGNDGDSVWASYMGQYKLERWDLDGRLHDVLSRETNWSSADYAERRPPGIQHIRQDERGWIWVMVIVPLDDWRPSHGGDPDDHFDTVIDVIDPVEGRLIVSTRVDMALARWAGDDVAYSYTEASAGRMLMDVWRVRLERP